MTAFAQLGEMDARHRAEVGYSSATKIVGRVADLSAAIRPLSRIKPALRSRYLFKPTPWNRTAHLPSELVVTLANLPSNRKPDELVFDYAGRGSVRGAWNNVCKRAGIERLTPHCCRHGFATTMLHKGFDVKTVAEMGGWKDATTVLRTYAHTLNDKTVTDALFDTPATRGTKTKPATTYNERKKAK